MFGFLIGAACLGGLAALLHRPHHHHFGHHYGHGCHGFRGGSRRRSAGLYFAFQRLDTTPGQEKAIIAAIDEFREGARTLRNKVRASRTEVAAALRAEHFDAARFDAVVARHAEDFATMGSGASVALGKIHEALDPEQRQRLARWLESYPGFFDFA